MALAHDSDSKIIIDPVENEHRSKFNDNKKSPKKSSRKIYIPIRIQANALKKDDIAINAAYISIEDLPAVETGRAQKKDRDVEIRYLESIRSFRDKIKSAYSCNQEQCPIIKERLNQHQLEHHTSNAQLHRCSHSRRSQTKLKPPKSESNSRETIHRLDVTEPQEKVLISLSPKTSILKRTISPKYMESISIQTLPKYMDVNDTDRDNIEDNIFKSNNNATYSHNSSQYAEEFNATETKIGFTTKNCVMKDDLQDVIMKWFDDIPIYSNITPYLKNLRQNLINEFIEKNYVLSNQEYDKTAYENNVRTEIDKLLNVLPMWYPEGKHDQDLLKEGIKNNFIVKVRDLLGKVHCDKQILKDVKYGSVNTDTSTYPLNHIDDDRIAKLIESEVLDWLMQVKFKESEDFGRTINIIDVTDIFSKRLIPLLNKPVITRNFKLKLKYLIINTLNDLPYVLQCPKNKKTYLDRIAEELTNRLIYIQVKCRNLHRNCKLTLTKNMYQTTVNSNSNLRQSVLEGVNSWFGDLQTHSPYSMIEDVTDILVNCIESIYSEDIIKNNETNEVISKSDITPKIQPSITVSDGVNIIDVVPKNIMNHKKYSKEALHGPCISKTVSVFTSESELSGSFRYPITSTPKRKPSKKDIIKQNLEEIHFTKKVSDLIRAWMDTLPHNFDDRNFKETAIEDLAGDIVDQSKLEQLVPKSGIDRNKIMSYTIVRWLYRFGIFDDPSEDTPQIGELIKHLNEMLIPNLTTPRQGNRQAMAIAKVKETDRHFFVPKGIDVLEDEISMWMNEQPTEIYSKSILSNRIKMVHELAEKLQNYMLNQKTEKDINNEISKWLKKNLKSSEKKNIIKLSEELRERISKVPQDYTLKQNLHKKIDVKLNDEIARLKPNQELLKKDNTQLPTDIDKDRTLKEFISKFMAYNYDVDDSIAREAYAELLKTEFRKLSPPTRKEVYENFTNSKKYEDLSTERFETELEYIKIVSDWLRNIPIKHTFNTPHNSERIEFVNNLAKNIYEIEEERRIAPMAMDYNLYLASIIRQFTNQLPILPEHINSVTFMIDELISKIISSRTPITHCQNRNKTLSSQNSSGTEKQNISDFIENYIHVNVEDFADDPMKMDAWSARVIKEVKKIVHDTADPSTLCKSQVYDKLTKVSIPGDESVRFFTKELDYATEISDWMKNLPLIQNPQANDLRVKLICEFAEFLLDREKNSLANKSEFKTDAEIENYIIHWIEKIPIDSKKDMKIPILVQQLLKRIETVNKGKQTKYMQEEIMKNYSSNTSKKSMTKPNKSQSKTPNCNMGCCGSGKTRQSGQIVVDAIENWSKNLPVQSTDREKEKAIQEEVARKLYQKVGELCIDPQIMTNDLLFQELLADEVNNQLNNIPQNSNMEKKRDYLMNDLVNKITNAKRIVQESVAGDTYKYRLENTIEASIPNPISKTQKYDPGFEIYKNRLADMFILENFDHGNDAIKMKYEKRIRNEIDKYYQNAQKRNALPLNKKEIYNELYSALFKVPIPNETSTMEEVEEVKTRCEIDAWFETLPIQKASSLTDLLEWDKILSMLAKRLHRIEQEEKNPYNKMHKEISKWVVKFPLLPGHQNNVDKFADDLQNRLRYSKADRKCVNNSATRKETKKDKFQKKSLKKTDSACNINQLLDSSITSQKLMRPTSPEPQKCCKIAPAPRKKPAELILEIIETWCDQLPFSAKTVQDQENNKIIKDNLLAKIIMKICELNSNPQTYNDDILYDYFLGVELENLISNLPIYCEFEKTMDAKQFQLKEAIKSVIPLMKEDRARHEYKQDLRTTIIDVLKEPLNSTAEKLTLFNQIREDIVDNFIQYNYNVDDDEGKQVYKAKLHEIVLKYFQDIKDHPDEHPVDPLFRENQLLCELAKVPLPSESVLKDEVEAIKMKNEVQEFFEDILPPGEAEDKVELTNSVKLSLAKRLDEIEKTGHNCRNDSKMKKEVNKYLNKLNLEIKPDQIDAFVNKLKMNEPIRKVLPLKATGPTASMDVESQFLKVPSINEFVSKESRNSGTTPATYRDFGIDIPTNSSPLPDANKAVNSQTPSISCIDMPQRCPIEHFASDERIPRFCEPTCGKSAPLAQGNPTNIRNRRRSPHSDEDQSVEKCKCGRRLIKLRGKPRCILRMKDCKECDQFEPMWIPMPYGIRPHCFYF